MSLFSDLQHMHRYAYNIWLNAQYHKPLNLQSLFLLLLRFSLTYLLTYCWCVIRHCSLLLSVMQHYWIQKQSLTVKILCRFDFPFFGKTTWFPHLGTPELSSRPRGCDPAYWFLIVVKVQRMGPIWVQEFQDLHTRSIKSCDHYIIQARNHQSSRTLTGI